jgi:hypothetical protein
MIWLIDTNILLRLVQIVDNGILFLINYEMPLLQHWN